MTKVESEWCCKTKFIMLNHVEGKGWQQLEPGIEPEREAEGVDHGLGVTRAQEYKD